MCALGSRGVVGGLACQGGGLASGRGMHCQTGVPGRACRQAGLGMGGLSGLLPALGAWDC
eukprot:34935-Chlamydomonas_euryale.AAC.1